MSTTHYDVLQVAPGAQPAVVRASWRALCQQYHPDRNAGDAAEATAQMQRINQAYEVLSDPVRRARYDARLAAERASPAPAHASAPAPTSPAAAEPSMPTTGPVAARAARVRLPLAWGLGLLACMLGALALWRAGAPGPGPALPPAGAVAPAAPPAAGAGDVVPPPVRAARELPADLLRQHQAVPLDPAPAAARPVAARRARKEARPGCIYKDVMADEATAPAACVRRPRRATDPSPRHRRVAAGPVLPAPPAWHAARAAAAG